MDWLKNFFIPMAQLIVIIGSLGFLVIIIYRAFSKHFNKTWKFFIKYSILRRDYDEKKVEWCINALENGYDYWKAKKFLLINNVKPDDINELMYIFNKIMKGGVKNGGFKSDNSESQRTKYPKI